MIRTLALQGYRGFQSFGLSDLKRVNLLVGKNNCGKTSILEAIDLLVSRGNSTVLAQSAHRRGEIGPLRGMEQSSSRGQEMLPDTSHLFFGRQLKQGATLRISSDDDVGTLLVELLSLPEVEDALGLRDSGGTRQTPFFADDLNPEPVLGFRVTGNVPNWFYISPVLHDGLLLFSRSVRSEISRSEPVPEAPPVKFLTADSLQPDSMRIMWDRVLAEGRESEVINAMKLLESDLDSIHFLTDDAYRGTSGGVVGRVPQGRPSCSVGQFRRRNAPIARAISLLGENRQWVPLIGRGRYRPAFFSNGRDVETCGHDRSGIECTSVCDNPQLRLHPGTRGSLGVQSRFCLGGLGSEDRALPCGSREPGRGAGTGWRYDRTSRSDSAGVPSRKAVLHTWLAWQEEPGLPYGTAHARTVLSAMTALRPRPSSPGSARSSTFHDLESSVSPCDDEARRAENTQQWRIECSRATPVGCWSGLRVCMKGTDPQNRKTSTSSPFYVRKVTR